MTKFLCAKCGLEFDGEPNIVGYADLHEIKDGEAVPDVGLYVCSTCADELRKSND